MLEFALWIGAAAAITTVFLIVYAFVLRALFNVREKRHHEFLKVWRPVLAEVTLSETDELPANLPPLQRHDLENFLHEWNILRDSVTGSVCSRLNRVAHALGIRELARRMLTSPRLHKRLVATATLGHLGDVDRWTELERQMTSDNGILSLLSARALVQIDQVRAMPLIIPMIVKRDDWPAARLATLLQEADPRVVTQPLQDAIFSSPPEQAAQLMAFLHTIPQSDADAVVHSLLTDSDNDYVITACLKFVVSPLELGVIRRLATHARWHIRMLAVAVLGRLGEPQDEPRIAALLEDREWWVRYRSAQALAGLPWMDNQKLREIQSDQTDRFARDILDHVIAEMNLA